MDIKELMDLGYAVNVKELKLLLKLNHAQELKYLRETNKFYLQALNSEAKINKQSLEHEYRLDFKYKKKIKELWKGTKEGYK